MDFLHSVALYGGSFYVQVIQCSVILRSVILCSAVFRTNGRCVVWTLDPVAVEGSAYVQQRKGEGAFLWGLHAQFPLHWHKWLKKVNFRYF